MRPLGCWLLVASLAIAVEKDSSSDIDESARSELTKSQISGQIEKLQADADLDAAVKKDAIDLLKTALDDWDQALEAEQRKLRLQRQVETAVRELETLRQKLAAMPVKGVVSLPGDADTEQIERHRDELERSLDQPETGLRERVANLEQERSERPARLESLGEELSNAVERLQEIRSERKSLPEDDESPVAAAHRLALEVAVHRAEQDVAALESEQAWLESTDADRWIDVLQQIAEREVARVEDELQQVEERLEAQRRREAGERVEQARQESAAVHPALKPWTTENQQLAERSRRLTERLEQVEEETDAVDGKLKMLQKEADDLRETVETVGRNDAIGLMLRQQSSRLPNVKSWRRKLADCEEEIRDIKLKRFEIDRQVRATPDVETVTQSAQMSENQTAVEINPADLQQQAGTVLTHRRKLLSQLDDDYDSLFDELVKLARSERELLKVTQETAKFYGEQMLWVRTSSVFGLNDLRPWQNSARWFRAPESWQALPVAVLQDLEHRPAIYLLAVAVAWGALLLGSRSRRSSGQSPDPDFSLGRTAWVAFATAVRAGLFPASLAFIAWRLDQSASGSDDLPGISQGLWRCAMWIWPLNVLRCACAADGLAVMQLGWTPDAARRISRQVFWFLLPSTALMFVVGATEIAKNEVITDSLGRSAFLVLMALAGLFCRGLLSGQTPTLDLTANDPWRRRWTKFLSIAIPLAPWALAAVAFAGYYDTALRLAGRLEATAWFWLILSGLKSAGAKWIAGEQQRLEMVPATARAEPTAEVRSLDTRKSLFARLRERQAARGLTPAQVGRQIFVLLQTALLVTALAGLTTIWSDVLPITGVGEQWTLWPTISTHQVIETGDNGVSTVRTVNRLEPVTAVDLGLALLICAVTYIAARNIPGLVEVLFLERLALDVGGRFAVTILVRYALFVVGVTLACARINVGWANVQWLVAAASVGLGFGLQDIFANFVSGIILLFERPIRVGDVITIGDTTGTVNQIRFRSTTIVDADRKELVVPNKDLITGKLLNWTLSDHTNRIQIRVAVGYDSDPNRVRQLLQEIALAHPTVLKEPPPTATLEEFGPNTLIFMLRAFLPSLDDRSKVNHELHSTIHARLQAAGIGTPVPPAPKPSPPPQNVAA